MRQTIVTVLLLALVAPFAWSADNKLTREEKRDGWKLLYNGRSLKGWMTSKQRAPECSIEEDGTFNPHRCGGYLLVTEHQYGDFILSLDFKLSFDANSGVFLRTYPPAADFSARLSLLTVGFRAATALKGTRAGWPPASRTRMATRETYPLWVKAPVRKSFFRAMLNM